MNKKELKKLNKKLVLDAEVMEAEISDLFSSLKAQKIIIKDLNEESQSIKADNQRFKSTILDLRTEVANSKNTSKNKTKPKKDKLLSNKNGVFSLDFWPLRDWFRLSYSKWSPGQYAQLCIGPFRLDWFAG